MYIDSSLYMGHHFLFLPGADHTNPVKLRFKERDVSGRSGIKASWKERIYLSPSILPRKWMDYAYRERFIPSVEFDTVLPVEAAYPFANKTGSAVECTLKTVDKTYKKAKLHIINGDGAASSVSIGRLLPGSSTSVSLSAEKPGIYTVVLEDGRDKLFKSRICFFSRALPALKKYSGLSDPGLEDAFQNKRCSLHCGSCGSVVWPLKASVVDEYVRMNYIPIKAYFDDVLLETGGVETFIRRMKSPSTFRRGLVHLLNMLRLASIEDELTIVKNFFRDDPPFAYFVTGKLFLFDMIPVLRDRELQKVLNKTDDDILSRALSGAEKPVMEKISRNISKRRCSDISSWLNKGYKPGIINAARVDVHSAIRFHFEERYGRELKIPSSKKILYTRLGLDALLTDDGRTLISRHAGPLILFNGIDAAEIPLDAGGCCCGYDVEWFGDPVFHISSAGPGSVVLGCDGGVRSGIIHVYDWTSSLEDYEYLERIPRGGAVPLLLKSPSAVLTAGILGLDGRPREQVIRLKIRG